MTDHQDIVVDLMKKNQTFSKNNNLDVQKFNWGEKESEELINEL